MNQHSPAGPEPSRPLTVVSIVGPGRSGSTLLARILGELPGALNVGELRWLWTRGLQERRPCSCGVPPAECPLWSGALTRLFGEIPAGSAPAVLEITSAQQRLAQRRWASAGMRTDWHHATLRAAMEVVRAATGGILDALAAETGARLVVDSSKRPLDAAVLAGVPGITQHVVHLVRDPRAVAYSWSRTKPLPKGSAREVMARRSAQSSAARWVESMVGSGRLRGQVPGDRWHVMRYEDLVADPVAQLRKLGERLGEPVPAALRKDGIALSLGHTVAGNPSRFATGDIAIQADDEWVHSMPGGDRLVVTALTLPWLQRFGYPIGQPVLESRRRRTAA